jgi:hypothetical protein
LFLVPIKKKCFSPYKIFKYAVFSPVNFQNFINCLIILKFLTYEYFFFQTCLAYYEELFCETLEFFKMRRINYEFFKLQKIKTKIST